MFKFSFLVFTALIIFQPAFSNQEITIKHVSVKAARFNEAAVLNISYDVSLLRSVKEMEEACDTIGWYNISAYLIDSNYIHSATGYTKLGDSLGRVVSEHTVVPSRYSKTSNSHLGHIPLAAFNLEEGVHYVRLAFSARDNEGNEITCNFKSDSFDLLIPPRTKLKLAVSSILVSDTDYRGEPWDDFVFKPNNAKPDVYWTTVLMDEKLNFPDYANNNYTYTDPDGLDNFDFSICRGDIFYIKVYDFDIMSKDDFIGSIKVDMSNNKNICIHRKTKFGLVLDMDYSLTLR